MVCPSGLKATESTQLAGPVSADLAGTGWAGSLMVHNSTLRDPLLAAARVRPSGLIAIAWTAAGPVLIVLRLIGRAKSAMSQSRTVASV
jgi:hypothetical protein